MAFLQIPTPPQLESDFVIVDVAECNENEDKSQEELYETLEKDLKHQIEVRTSINQKKLSQILPSML